MCRNLYIEFSGPSPRSGQVLHWLHAVAGTPCGFTYDVLRRRGDAQFAKPRIWRTDHESRQAVTFPSQWTSDSNRLLRHLITLKY